MVTEIFNQNQATTTVSSGGTTAPSSGTSETWTVVSSTMFPAAVTGTSQFHVVDAATGYTSEIIAVTNVSGTTWTVTRGAETTTPVAHLAGFTIYQDVTTGFLGSLGGGGSVSSVFGRSGAVVATSGDYTAAQVTGAAELSGAAFTGALSTTPVTLTDAATITVNAAASNVFRVTLGGNRTLGTPASPTDGQQITVEVIQPASGGPWTLAYSAAYSFTASTPQPSLSTAANSRDLISFLYDAGTSLWICTGYVLSQNGVLVAVAQGGTGQTTAAAAFSALSPLTTLGDLLYENSTPAPARLPGNTTATKNYLTQTGTGSVSAAPAWGAIAAADLPAASTSLQGAVILDGTAGDIQAPGVQAAGSSGKAADAKHVHPENAPWIPADNGLLAATDLLSTADATVQPVAGTLYLVKVPIRVALTATYLWTVVGTAGSGTSTGTYIGLYSSSGTLLTGSSDIGSQLTTGFVSRQLSLTTAQALSAGSFVWVALLVNMPTMPYLRQLNNGTVLANINLTAATYRFATNGTGLTALPGTITPASNAAPTISPFWFGIS